MKILSVTTSSPICAVAILDDTKLLGEISLDNGLTHSESLMPIIDKILKDKNLSFKDIDLLVCDVGPGSFTGIRVGIATLKAFHDSLNIPAIGVNSLEALQYNVSSQNTICSLIDAKKNNVYSEIFKQDFILQNPTFLCISELISFIKNNIKDSQITFVGDGAVAYQDQINNEIKNCTISTNTKFSAYNFGLVGFKKYTNSNFSELEPLYLRKTQAEQSLEENKNGNR